MNAFECDKVKLCQQSMKKMLIFNERKRIGCNIDKIKFTLCELRYYNAQYYYVVQNLCLY